MSQVLPARSRAGFRSALLATVSHGAMWRRALANDGWIARRDPRGQFGWVMTRAKV